MDRPTDQWITCPCCGASRRVSLATYRRLCRLASPTHEEEWHRVATEQPRQRQQNEV